MSSLPRSLVRDAAYRERVRVQTLNWAMGRSYHNRVDDECCPDFSCCCPELFVQDPAARWKVYSDSYGSGGKG